MIQLGRVLLSNLNVILSLFIGLFWFYRSSHALGFSRTKVLDIFIYSLSAAVVVYLIFRKNLSFNLGLTAVIFLVLFYYLTSREKWSFPKIADLMAESLCLSFLTFPWRGLLPNLAFIVLLLIILRIKTMIRRKPGIVFFFSLLYFSLIVLILGHLKGRSLSINFFLFLVLAYLSLLQLRRLGSGFSWKRLFVFPRPRFSLIGIRLSLSRWAKRGKVDPEESQTEELSLLSVFCTRCGGLIESDRLARYPKGLLCDKCLSKSR